MNVVRFSTCLTRALLRRVADKSPAASYSYFSERSNFASADTVFRPLPNKSPTEVYTFTWIHTTAWKCQSNEVDLSPENCIAFNDFKSAVKNNEVQVVDVRTPEEVSEGHIPAKRYVNIPVQELGDALMNLSENQFKTKFGIDKPNKSATDIVFHCKLGARSTTALRIAKSAGYQKVRHFPGGWTEWSEKA